MIPRFFRSMIARPLMGAAVLLTLLAGVILARPEPQVRDQAGLLNSATTEQVNAIIKEIRQRFDKDLTIATFDKIPDRLAASFAAKDKQQFYDDWLTEEARAAGTNGVFILIVKDPGHLQIGVGNSTRRRDFILKDRDELNAMMLKAFREKKFDQGVIDGAKFVLTRMEQNRAGHAPDPPGAGSSPATQPATNEKSDPNAFK